MRLYFFLQFNNEFKAKRNNPFNLLLLQFKNVNLESCLISVIGNFFRHNFYYFVFILCIYFILR